MGSYSKPEKGERLFEAVNTALLVIILLIVMYPLYYVVIVSFSNPIAAVSNKVHFFPVGFEMESYRQVFRNQEILTGYMNTIFITVVGTCFNLAATICGAYALSRRDLYGRNAIMFFMTFTMYFSGGLIPNYLIIRGLGLVNSRWALIIPSLISTYNLIIMRTYFQTGIPYELHEAARIDGASDIGILLRIILPLAKPIIAVISLYYAVNHWNVYFSAMIYLTDRKKYTLQLILREILIKNQVSEMMDVTSETAADQFLRIETLKYAVIVVSSVPLLLIYPVIQKFFEKGVMIGAIKG